MKAAKQPPHSNSALEDLTAEVKAVALAAVDEAVIEEVAAQFLASYRADERARRVSRRFLPSREAIVEILEAVLDLMYPGYFGRRDISYENLDTHVAQAVAALAPKLEREIEHCLCYGREREAERPEFTGCGPRAHEVAAIFLRRLAEIRALLIRDVQAAFDGDPAATNLDEVILAYPGVLAVSVYRIAHALYDLGVPMMARIMTEWAHSKTGADIHPGASIGPAFFIDHATGVVIGETTHIGEGVKLYQGVTLGALSFPRDASGHIIRGRKRHPTVESGATLYANATVLGGQTVVGAESVIGGSVFLTRSVPARSRVSLKEPDLRVASRDGAAEPDAIYFDI
ncbi:MAG TPA: serine acetyltransferase [Steroidobacteraceae bacterium]|jgi:serine O-acetyltransferase|nr:serine acetyltransferase [Steroidobacteraceae bacterium]